MNKFFKFILFSFFVILSFAAANLIKDNQANQEIISYYQLPDSQQITLPAQLLSQKNYSSTLKSIEEVSAKADTPFIFRVTDLTPPNDGQGKAQANKHTGEITFFGTDIE